MTRSLWVTLVLAGVLLWATDAARAQTVEVHDGEDLFAVLESAQPGDEVWVYTGSWTTPGYVMLEWHGTAAEPIVVRAADGETPHIVGDPSQNILNITGEHFTFQGFELTGGSHGLRLYDVHDALLEDLHIHDTDEVALSANIPDNEYYNITFRGLHLHHTGGHGEGMYLGCNDAACVFHDNLIEGNYIHDTNHGVSQGDGIEIKQGSYGNTVRNNVIHDTQYPCIIVYGTAGGARNVVEGNALWNCGDSGIQAAADAVLRNNLIFNAGNGINSHTHQGAVPSDLLIVHNTVIGASDRCLRASDWGGSTGIVVANNAFYCDGGGAVRLNGGEGDIVFVGNVITGSVEGVSDGYVVGNGADQDFADVAALDAWPTAGSPLIDQAEAAHAAEYDFNWTPRGGSPDVGAYEWQGGGNPGWIVAPAFRDGDPPPLPAGDDGCSCNASGGTSVSMMLLLLALLCWLRRRQGWYS